MDNNDTVIAINPEENGDIEFDVAVEGLEKRNLKDVRFVVTTNEDFDYSFHAKPVENTKHTWTVNVNEIFKHHKQSDPFRIEIIIGDYYFKAGAGKIVFVSDPEIKYPRVTTKEKYLKNENVGGDEFANEIIKKAMSKTKQNVSENINRAEEEPSLTKPAPLSIKKQSTVLTEANVETVGQYAPTNNLLTPEFKPKDTQSNIKDNKFSEKPFSFNLRKETPGEGEPPMPDTDWARKATEKYTKKPQNKLMKYFVGDNEKSELSEKEKKIRRILRNK